MGRRRCGDRRGIQPRPDDLLDAPGLPPDPLRKRRSPFRIDVTDDHLLDAVILGEHRGVEHAYPARA